MKSISRRSVLKLASASATSAVMPGFLSAQTPVAHSGNVAQWDCFEAVFDGPEDGNPFTEVEISATFSLEHREVRVNGFYDGEGKYRVRFLPDQQGLWRYQTQSNRPALEGRRGEVHVTASKAGAQGPVRVQNKNHFAHADGTPFFPFGTTCYAWIHQSESLQQQTLTTLKTAPFNKLRMCVFPKHYEYNHNEPPFYPFVRDANGNHDWTRFNPAFFLHLEERVKDLGRLGIQADLILFHPYDNWGYSNMPADADDRYLRYVLARLSAFPNIWWSLANEYDLMKHKTAQDFDRFFHIVEECDPYAHLRSIHYSSKSYDYSRPWVSHASLQAHDFDASTQLLGILKKPILFDEVQYEGNLNRRWGNISGESLAHRFWLGVIHGCYVSHGETLLMNASDFNEDATPTLWWAHGGVLHGTSPQQIGFLRHLVEETVKPGIRAGLQPQEKPYYLNASAVDTSGKTGTVLYYFDEHQPVWYEFPLPEGTFTAEMIDPVAGTIHKLDGTYQGKTKLQLAGKPFQAMRFQRV